MTTPSPRTAAGRALRTPLLRWLRGSHTRRMFARALGLGDGPLGGDAEATYLRMATATLDKVATELAAKPQYDPTAIEAEADFAATERDRWFNVPEHMRAEPAGTCQHDWTASTAYTISPGLPGSVCAKCGAFPTRAKPAGAGLREALTEAAAKGVSPHSLALLHAALAATPGAGESSRSVSAATGSVTPGDTTPLASPSAAEPETYTTDGKPYNGPPLAICVDKVRP